MERLQSQLELVKEDRQKAHAAKDSVRRELAFTRAELERYQREHNALSVQVKRLLFVVESGPDASFTLPENETDMEQFLFTNIEELQKQNLELISRLKTMEAEQGELIKNMQSDESVFAYLVS